MFHLTAVTQIQSVKYTYFYGYTKILVRSDNIFIIFEGLVHPNPPPPPGILYYNRPMLSVVLHPVCVKGQGHLVVCEFWKVTWTQDSIGLCYICINGASFNKIGIIFTYYKW